MVVAAGLELEVTGTTAPLLSNDRQAYVSLDPATPQDDKDPDPVKERADWAFVMIVVAPPMLAVGILVFADFSNETVTELVLPKAFVRETVKKYVVDAILVEEIVITLIVSSNVERMSFIPSTGTFAEVTENLTVFHLRPRLPVLAVASMDRLLQPERVAGTFTTTFGETGLIGGLIGNVAAAAAKDTQSGVVHNDRTLPAIKLTLFKVSVVSTKIAGKIPVEKEATTVNPVVHTHLVVSVVPVTVK